MREYEQIKTEALLVRKQSDANNWKLGDLCLEVEDIGDANFIKGDKLNNAKYLLLRLSDDIGITPKKARVSASISRRIEPDTDLGWIRRSTLPYAHVRELYTLEEDTELNEYARKSLQQDWTIRELRAELSALKAEKAVEAGELVCALCKEIIQDAKVMYKITNQKSHIYVCGVICGMEFFRNLYEESEDIEEIRVVKEGAVN